MDAFELFGICRELAQSQPSAAATRQLHELLVLVCAEGCRQQGGTFGNLFSQVDFLGKRIGLTIGETIALQTVRRHTNTGAPISTEDWPYDVMAVARLVASVFKEDVPGELLRLLPVDRRPLPQGLHVDKKYIRCIVRKVEDSVIIADTEDGEVAFDYSNTENGRDFSYLQKIVRPGMQLNLLDCHLEEKMQTPPPTPPLEGRGGPCTVVVPGIVIVEPDFLIDISSIAACFTNYGHHPLLYTLNRLKERANSQAILLGNFAGTALDDIINLGSEATTAGSLRRSFREQALQFCACPDFDAQQFRQQAEVQMRNIREAVALLQPKGAIASIDSIASIGPIGSSPFLLEPSFVCEHLGLQGRVDLMTTDMSLLVEQKSGKNKKIEYQSHDSHGQQLENHYVQLLLYYGVLRYNFGLSDRQVSIRLLYSRYPAAQGLLTVNYYRTLLREALRLRNQIVATELLIARDGFQRILPLLREDVIYKGIARDSHFHRFVQPEIATLTAQLAQLSPLERAYYVRMLTFVYREQVAQKLGSSESNLHHSGGCYADLWQMPLSEKRDTGNILTGQTNTDAPNFRQGDMVYVYNYKGEPDVRKSILFKGTLQELTADSVTVVLNDAQQVPVVLRLGDGDAWAVEHGSSDFGTTSSIRSLHRFICANPHRRNLLLGQRPPEADTRQRLSRHYHPHYDDILLGIKQTRDYFLLVGPPGTGKTSMALKYMVEEELQTEGASILLTAYTNRAVDEICAMLCTLTSSEPGKAAAPLFLRLGRVASCDKRFHPYLLDTVLASTGKLDDARTLIEQTPIIVATTSMLQVQPWLLELKHFTLAVVDEASQILEPNIIGLLSSEAIDRFVLVGDHKQLPAVVQQEPQQSVVTEQVLLDIGLSDCRQSLFERLLRWERQQGRTLFTGILHSHGRMHPDVAAFPLTHFYCREQLCAVPLPHQQEASLGYDLPARDELDCLLQTHRVLFIDTECGEDVSEEQSEAYLVAELLERIHRFTHDHFDPTKTVGVIVPYRRQIALIRQSMEHHFPVLWQEAGHAISIDTVERYQGSQRDVIIYSFGVSHRYQLDFLTATTFTDDDGALIDRKLNVALTRARRQTVIVGKAEVLRHVILFRQLMEPQQCGAGRWQWFYPGNSRKT